jgi:hypothetical protein
MGIEPSRVRGRFHQEVCKECVKREGLTQRRRGAKKKPANSREWTRIRRWLAGRLWRGCTRTGGMSSSAWTCFVRAAAWPANMPASAGPPRACQAPPNAIPQMIAGAQGEGSTNAAKLNRSAGQIEPLRPLGSLLNHGDPTDQRRRRDTVLGQGWK